MSRPCPTAAPLDLTLEDRAATIIAQRADAAIDDLFQWLGISSFSRDRDGANRMAAALHDAVACPSLHVDVTRATAVGDHLCWRTATWDRLAGRGVLLLGHHDTVFPAGTFDRRERVGGRMHGPGVLDMKGGLAVIRLALAALDQLGVLAEMPVALLSVADEELGSHDSGPLLRARAGDAAAALVFEPGRAGDAIITARKGVGEIAVRARGRAAHPGNALADGINAIAALARFIEAAHQLTDPARDVSVSVGTLAGGSACNMVPAHAECELDIRFATAADGDDLVARLRAIATQVSAATGAELTVAGGPSMPPMQRTRASRALYHAYAASARGAGIQCCEAPVLGGGSDANVVASLGVPAIDGLGPLGLGFHTPDEHVELASIPRRAEALARFLLSHFTDLLVGGPEA